MSRKAKRATIQTTIAALAGFAGGVVYKAARRKFEGRSPVGVLLSASELNQFQTRGATLPDWNTYGYTLTLYVRADEGSEDTAEDTLDDLRDSVGSALRSLGCDVGESSAPDGAPLRSIDGILYRTERIPFILEEY
jgi:hypothetical protein